jgi:DNA polymerase-4
LRLAARKAPTAVTLPVDAAAYEAASAQVMAVLRGMDGAVVEVLGWDEAFVGVRTGDPEALAGRVQTEVLAASRLHCSVDRRQQDPGEDRHQVRQAPRSIPADRGQLV